MKLWQIIHNGIYLGGTAIVFADSKDEAASLLRASAGDVKYEVLSIKELPIKRGVVYHDSGDY